MAGEEQQEHGCWNDDIAQWYITEYGDHPFNRMTAEKASPGKGDWILDIGCGSGSALRAAGELVSEGVLVGVDPSPAMVQAATDQSKGQPFETRLKFITAPAEDLPLPESWFDQAWAINSMHHWSDMPRGLAEIAHILKPEGRFILVEEIFEEEGRGLDLRHIQGILRQAGFEITLTDQIEAPDSEAVYIEATYHGQKS